MEAREVEAGRGRGEGEISGDWERKRVQAREVEARRGSG